MQNWFVTTLILALSLAVFVPNSAQATLFRVWQAYPEGASVTGLFEASDANGDGLLTSGTSSQDEVGFWSFSFSGNSQVPRLDFGSGLFPGGSIAALEINLGTSDFASGRRFLINDSNESIVVVRNIPFTQDVLAALNGGGGIVQNTLLGQRFTGAAGPMVVSQVPLPATAHLTLIALAALFLISVRKRRHPGYDLSAA